MYEFTEKMSEISRFGGNYEATCRAMLKAGLEWRDKNPEANPQFHGYKNIYGIIEEDNEDAKALSKAVINVTNDCTSAMHQAVISSILFVLKNGWNKYVEEMSKRR